MSSPPPVIQTAFALATIALLLASARVWVSVAQRLRAGLPIVPSRFRYRPVHVPRFAVVIALAWLGVNVLPALFLKEPATTDLDHIRRMVVGLIVLDGAVISALAAALFLGAGSRTDLLRLGFRGDDPAAQLRDGWRGFVAVALPMTIALMASQPLHNENSQHALLRLIRATGDPWDIGSVLLAAAVMAPLTEELLFRVTLQNWLAETLTPLHATLYTAALFAAVHGYRDALGIFVLAIVLGVVYQARRSYLAVVALHAIFNAYMTTATLVWPADGP